MKTRLSHQQNMTCNGSYLIQRRWLLLLLGLCLLPLADSGGGGAGGALPPFEIPKRVFKRDRRCAPPFHKSWIPLVTINMMLLLFLLLVSAAAAVAAAAAAAALAAAALAAAGTAAALAGSPIAEQSLAAAVLELGEAVPFSLRPPSSTTAPDDLYHSSLWRRRLGTPHWKAEGWRTRVVGAGSAPPTEEADDWRTIAALYRSVLLVAASDARCMQAAPGLPW